MKKIIILIVAFLMILLSATSFRKIDPPKWLAPEALASKKNPIVSNPTSIANGKDLYTTHCVSCHGKRGKGDGTKAAQLETECGDFTLSSFQKQSDGSLFYKIQTGKDDMPSFKKKIPDVDDIWNVINYMRTLK